MAENLRNPRHNPANERFQDASPDRQVRHHIVTAIEGNMPGKIAYNYKGHPANAVVENRADGWNAQEYVMKEMRADRAQFAYDFHVAEQEKGEEMIKKNKK